MMIRKKFLFKLRNILSDFLNRQEAKLAKTGRFFKFKNNCVLNFATLASWRFKIEH